MRYKVGDKVIIRKDLIAGKRYYYEHPFDKLLFNKEMSNLCGRVCVITKITDSILDEYFLSIDGEEISWYFNNAMLLPAGSLRYLVMERRQQYNESI